MRFYWRLVLVAGLTLIMMTGVAAAQPYSGPDTPLMPHQLLNGDDDAWEHACEHHGPGFIQAPGTDICIYIPFALGFPNVESNPDTVKLDPRVDTETGPLRSVIDIRNQESVEVEVDILVGQKDGGWVLAGTHLIGPYQIISVDAEDILEEEGNAPVVLAGTTHRGSEGGDSTACSYEDLDEQIRTIFDLLPQECKGIGTELDVEPEYDEVTTSPIPPTPAEIEAIIRALSGPPLDVHEAGEDHSMLDGHRALRLSEIFESPFYGYAMPIIQTNTGWNTIVYGASFSLFQRQTEYSIEVYRSGTPTLEPFVVIDGTLRSGQQFSHNILEHPEIDDGFIGSAVVRSEAPIGVIAERVKVETGMRIITVGEPVRDLDEPSTVPLVFLNWFGWNTGISFFNADKFEPMDPSIEFVPPTIEFHDDIEAIPPLGMDFIYQPGPTDDDVEEPGALYAAVIGGGPHLAEIDQVKYVPDGEGRGTAMSYGSIPDGDHATDGDRLVLPRFTKGDPQTGLGETTGIQFFNASPDHEAKLDIWIFDEKGFRVPPTMNEPLSQNLDPFGSYTLYPMFIPELAPGFRGSAQIDVTGQGRVGAVFNTVNYEIADDSGFSDRLKPLRNDADRVPSLFMVESRKTNEVGDPHTVSVTVFDQFAARYPGALVYAMITESDAGNYGTTLHPYPAYTDDAGKVELSYTSTLEGTDVITVWVIGIDTPVQVIKTWISTSPTEYDLILHHFPCEDYFFDRCFNPVNTDHRVVAAVIDQHNNPVPNVQVIFEVQNQSQQPVSVSGYVFDPNSPQVLYPGTAQFTNANGDAGFLYQWPVDACHDVIARAQVLQDGVLVWIEDSVKKCWED